MNVAGIIICVGEDERVSRPRRGTRPRVDSLISAALGAGLGDVVVVVGDAKRAEHLSNEVTVLLDEGGSQASALRSAIDWCVRQGIDVIVVTTLDRPLPGGDLAVAPSVWRALAATDIGPLVVATKAGRHAGIYRVEADVWPMLPLDGAIARSLDGRVELLRTLALDGDPEEGNQTGAGADLPLTETPVSDRADELHHAHEEASPKDVARVRELLGREPSGAFTVVVRDRSGDPVVIRNAPFLFDATPMPTRYWLVGKREQEAVGRLESSGGVRLLERLFDPDVIAATHDRYAQERDGMIDPGYAGPRPSGGVGGTRRGIKCLHAHLAWYLAGGADPVGRYVAHQLAEELAGPVGAIDCGTNSTRLLVLDRSGVVCAREMTITRLGQGTDETKMLNEDAIGRTLDALSKYREILDQFGVVRVRASTTSAARDAHNRADLLNPAREILGVELEVLPGDEEGRLSFSGATSDMGDGLHALVVDVGGGSTEFAAGVTGGDGGLDAVTSLNIGCVRITERFLLSDPPSPAELERARIEVAEVISALRREPKFTKPTILVAVAGTVATLATRARGLDAYDGAETHGTTVTRAFVDEELAALSKMTVSDRREAPGIEAARADVIVGGILVVQQVLESFGFDELRYSERDILDGMAMSLL